MKEEFEFIVEGLKEVSRNKINYLKSLEEFNAHTQGKINNVNQSIINLELSANDIILNYYGNQEMRINFKKRANEIKIEIDQLTV